jgi:hypothetical protein
VSASTRVILASSALVLLSCTHSLAHVDTIIRLDGTRLIGLPNSYLPAELDLKAFRLRIKNHEMEFSPLLKSFFDLPYDLQILSSWYHDPAIMPPYLTLEIHPRKKDYTFEVVLALENLRLIQITIVLQVSASTTQRFDVELSETEKREIRESIKRVTSTI